MIDRILSNVWAVLPERTIRSGMNLWALVKLTYSDLSLHSSAKSADVRRSIQVFITVRKATGKKRILLRINPYGLMTLQLMVDGMRLQDHWDFSNRYFGLFNSPKGSISSSVVDTPFIPKLVVSASNCLLLASSLDETIFGTTRREFRDSNEDGCWRFFQQIPQGRYSR